MIFIVASSWKCASIIGRREGLTHAQWIAWTVAHGADHKIRGIDEPRVWIADCGRDVLSSADRDMIISRRAQLTRVRCGS